MLLQLFSITAEKYSWFVLLVYFQFCFCFWFLCRIIYDSVSIFSVCVITFVRCTLHIFVPLSFKYSIADCMQINSALKIKTKKPRLRNIRRKWNGVLWCHLIFFVVAAFVGWTWAGVRNTAHSPTQTIVIGRSLLGFCYHFIIIYIYFISTILFSHNTLMSVSPR